MDVVEQMRTFVRIVDAGSLSAAARAGRLSLAAVSRQLSALEEDLGTALVVRTTRRLQITTSGRRWYEHCVRMLRELEQARADVRDAGDIRGTVVISAPVTLGTYRVVPRLHALLRAHPSLDLEIRLEDRFVDLVGDNVDIAVRAGIAPPDSSSLIAHPLDVSPWIVVASPEYLARAGTPRHPSELAGHDAIQQPLARWRFERRPETGRGRRGRARTTGSPEASAHAPTGVMEAPPEVVEVTPRVRVRSTTPDVLRDLAVAGLGLAMLPEWLVPRTLRRVLPDWQMTPPSRTWALHRIELRGVPRIRAVIAALTDARLR
jgi:DNA-binding transcriptional LysR family regulator